MFVAKNDKEKKIVSQVELKANIGYRVVGKMFAKNNKWLTCLQYFHNCRIMEFNEIFNRCAVTLYIYIFVETIPMFESIKWNFVSLVRSACGLIILKFLTK